MAVEISDWDDLDNVRNDLTGDYVLVNDLDSETDGYAGIGDDFEPIGFVSGDNKGDPFSGVLDGDGFQISDLVIEENDSSEGGVAFITQVGNGGLVENLSVDGTVNSTIDDFLYGGLAASVGDDGTGTIQNCVSHVDVTASNGEEVGGLVGQNYDTVTDSYATGSVEGGEDIGGLVGQNQGTIQTSYAVGFVTGKFSFIEAGALVGDNAFVGELSDSYADEETTGQTNITGDNSGSITNSYTLTTSEMQGDKASNDGNMDVFDYTNVWDEVLEEDGDTNADGYPILIALDRKNQLDAQGIFDPFITVETNPATDISEFSATLNGELVELGDEADDANVFFEFGESVTDSQTEIQTLTEPATFDELVDELEPNTTFEFRAIAEAQDANDETFTDEGEVLTFDTEIVTLDGTISLDDAGVENADVLVHNFTQDVFEGRLSTDIDGNYTVDLPDVDRLDTIAIAVDFDDGTERYGRLVTTVLE